LQRRTALLHTHLKTKRSHFKQVAQRFVNVSADTLRSVAEKQNNGDFSEPQSKEEQEAHDLLREVRAVTQHVPGSASSKTVMRNEIRGLIMDKGVPNFYITVNPADVYSPVL
ncbi:hypothetical protein BDZ89DRAFT_907139, partial [Hymenopellis radicata]